MIDRQAHVRAAAYAAASWVRARRAAWTVVADVEVGRVLPDSAVAAGPKDPPYVTIAAGLKAPPHMVTVVIDALRMLPEIARSVRFNPAPVLTLVWRMSTAFAAVASLIVLAMLAREYWQAAMQTQTAAKVRAAAVLRPLPAKAISASTGQLHVTAAPAPARVIVDGKPRGVTPLLIEDLNVGSHSVVFQNTDGTVEETVKIAGGDLQELAESIYPGWLMLYSPFDVTVSERGRAITVDEKHQVLLAPGPHDLRIENRALAYEDTRHVEIRPGDTAPLSIVPPKSTMTVTSGSAAQVWLDGALIGDTPVDVSVDLGTHALVLKYASGEQRQRSVIVTTKPLAIDM